MTGLTRRRDVDAPLEAWAIFYGDVQVGYRHSIRKLSVDRSPLVLGEDAQGRSDAQDACA